MRRAVRLMVWVMAVATGLILAIGIGLPIVLDSAAGRRLASDQLEHRIGGPVLVTGFNAGLIGPTTLDVSIPARTGLPDDPPVFVGRVVADVSATGLALGRAPAGVTVEGATLTLRFDAEGNSLDRFPEPNGNGDGTIPNISVRNGSVRILQAGRPEFHIGGVQAEISISGESLKLSGRIDDHTWGNWVLEGLASIDGTSGEFVLRAEAERHVTPELLRSLPFVSPAVWESVELEGDTSATIRIAKGADGWGYHIDLGPRNTRVTVHPIGLTFTDSSAKVGIVGAVVTLTDFRGKAADGVVTANGRGDFAADPETIALQVRAEGMDVSQLPNTWNLPPVERGTLSGSADLTIDIRDDGVQTHGRGQGTIDMNLLGGTGQLEVELIGDGDSLGFKPKQRTSQLLRAALLAVVLVQPAPALSADDASNPTVVKANLRLRDVDLAELAAQLKAELPFKVAGKVSLDVEAEIPLAEARTLNAYRARGKITLRELIVRDATFRDVAADLELNKGVLALTSLKAKVFDGETFGTATIPLREADKGEFRVEMTDWDAAALLRAVPDLPIRLEGRLGGAVVGHLPPTEAGQPRQAVVNLELQSPRMRIQGVPTDRLNGKVEYKPGEIVYELTGESLGGSFDLNGTYPLTPATPETSPGAEGRLRIGGVELGRLADAIRVPALNPLRGTVSLSVRYRIDAAGPVGEGRLRVTDFGWAGGTRERGDLDASVRITPDALDVIDLSGRLANGDLRGRARFNIANPNRSYFNLSLDRADATRLFAPFDLDAPPGLISVSTRGTFGKEIRGTGSIGAVRSDLGLTSLADVRIPFEYHFAPGGRGEVRIRDANAQAAGGRITGQATYRWGWESQLDGDIRFVNVCVRQLLGNTVGVTPGRANGRFTFTGRDVRSVRDVSGLLTANYGESNPFDAPILRQIAPYLQPTRPISTQGEGDIRARLIAGRFAVERFTLSSSNLRMYATGSVWLDGRLDLDVKARTGQVGPDGGALRLFGLRIPAIGPIPIGLVAEISRFLSNRMVLLRITGTVNQPSVQVNVAALLADETIRYFLGLDILSIAP